VWRNLRKVAVGFAMTVRPSLVLHLRMSVRLEKPAAAAAAPTDRVFVQFDVRV